MAVKDFISGLVGRFAPAPVRSASTKQPEVSALEFGGTRTSIPTFLAGGGGASGVLPRRVQLELGLDDRSFGNLSISDLMNVLIDSHPDVSFALWNFVRLGNSGYTIKVKKIGAVEDKPFTQADKVLQEFFDRLYTPNMLQFDRSHSFNKLIEQMLMSVVIRGAAAMEMVMTPGMDDCYFFSPVDPATVDFKFEGDRYIPSQNMQRISLDIPTFFYSGLDERIDDPYGRGPLLAALNMIMFQLQILNDIKAVVHNQGYPRFDIKIVEEVLLKRMPIQIRNNDALKQEWLNNKLKDIIAMYNSLEPDDTFVHYDSVEVGMVGGKGSGGGGAMIDPEKLMSVIDSLIMSGLKTLSTILGRRAQGNTESFAKLEIKLYMQGVKAIQAVVEEMLSKALTFYLNVRGKQGIVKFRFDPLDVRTDLEKAQFEQIHLLNCQFKRDQGWISQDQASILATGSAAVSQTPLVNDTPTNKDGGTPQGATDTNPSAGGDTTGDSSS
jgi:hypothetical protein